MKPPILTIILYGALFPCSDRQVAIASALTVIADLGRELTKTIFSNPMATITDMGKGLTFGYGTRSLSMGYSPRSLKHESALSAEDAARYLKHEQMDRDEIMDGLRKNRERARKLALSATPEITDFLIYWRGIAKSGFWFYRMYMARNAKKKLTKAEEARRQEYFCGNNEEDVLKEFCKEALDENSVFVQENGWHFDSTRSPQCELKKIVLEKYDYMSERGVLTCPIVIKREGEDDEYSSVYISSVDDPPKKRLVFYVFTEADEDIEEYARKLAAKEKKSSKSKKKDISGAGISLRTFLPAVNVLRAARNSEKGLTKSVLLPASASALKAIKNMDSEGGGIASYLPFVGSKKKTIEESPAGKPLKVVSLVVHKKAT